jgi:hypothetical protein
VVTAWGAWTNAGTPTLLADKGIDSLSDTGVGDTTVNWDPDFAVSTYGLGIAARIRGALEKSAANPTTAIARVATFDASLNPADPAYVSIVGTVVS